MKIMVRYASLFGCGLLLIVASFAEKIRFGRFWGWLLLLGIIFLLTAVIRLAWYGMRGK